MFSHPPYHHSFPSFWVLTQANKGMYRMWQSDSQDSATSETLWHNALKSYIRRFGCRNELINNTTLIFIATVIMKILRFVLSVCSSSLKFVVIIACLLSIVVDSISNNHGATFCTSFIFSVRRVWKWRWVLQSDLFYTLDFTAVVTVNT